MATLILGAPAHALTVHIGRATATSLSLELSVPDSTPAPDIPDWDAVVLAIVAPTADLEWTSTLRSSSTYAATYAWDLTDEDTDVTFNSAKARLEYRLSSLDPQLVAVGRIVVSG